MWSPNPGFPITVSMACGATLSTAISLPGAYEKIGIEIHSMTSGTDVYLQGSNDGTTYRRIFHETTTSTPAAIFVNSSITNCFVNIFRITPKYVKVELSTAMTATTACFKLLFY